MSSGLLTYNESRGGGYTMLVAAKTQSRPRGSFNSDQIMWEMSELTRDAKQLDKGLICARAVLE